MSCLRKFLRLSATERLLVAEALWYLFCARILLKFCPFHRIAPGLGGQNQESSSHLSEKEIVTAKKISRAIRIAARRVGAVCLPQALAARRMLHRRKISSTLYLGLQRPDSAYLAAHAWLRTGSYIVTGGSGHAQYQRIASFADLF